MGFTESSDAIKLGYARFFKYFVQIGFVHSLMYYLLFITANCARVEIAEIFLKYQPSKHTHSFESTLLRTKHLKMADLAWNLV